LVPGSRSAVVSRWLQDAYVLSIGPQQRGTCDDKNDCARRSRTDAGYLQANPDIVRNFKPTVLYELAAPRTPNIVRESVFAAMRNGQPCPSVEAIKREIEEARAPKLIVPVIDLSKAVTDADEFVFEDDGMSGAASELLAIFIGNLPTERYGTTARLLRLLDGWDLRKLASKIGFQALRVSHLHSLKEEELEN
jgi:hypothetical protein